MTGGIRNIVIGSPMGSWNEEKQRVEGEPRQLGEFYASLLGMRVLRDDWIVVGESMTTFPRLAFGDGWSDERPPRWPDPDYPAQLHLDIFVPDLNAAEAAVLELGGTRLEGGVFADPLGH